MPERMKRMLRRAGNFGLAAALVLAGVYAADSIFGGRGAGLPLRAEASRSEASRAESAIGEGGKISAAAEDSRAALDLNGLLGRDVFGEGTGGNAGAGSVLELTDGNLELRGTIAGDAAVARAIVLHKRENAMRVYKAGDALGGGRVKEIGRQRVIVEADGRELELRLKGGEGGAAAEKQVLDSGVSSVIAAKDESFAAAGTAAEEKPAASSAGRAGERVIETILARVKLEEEKQGGEAAGLRISNLSAVPAARLIGLQENDVITAINGQSVTSKQKAFQVMRKLQSQTRVDMELIRNHRKELLSFPLTVSGK